MLFLFGTIDHPMDSVFIGKRSVIRSPEHICHRHLNFPFFREFYKEPISFFSSIGMQGNMDIVPLLHMESERFGSVGSHKHYAAQDRKRDMHDQVLVLFRNRHHSFAWGNVAKPIDTIYEIASENRAIELEDFLGIVREVQVDSGGRHRKKIKK